MRVFITGTDTGVGKTTVARYLCNLWKADYFKPIQTGLEKDSDQMPEQTFIHPEAYHFKAPLSPHAAAEKEGKEIDLQKIQIPQSDRLIVEGAGGVLVPLNKTHLMIDLIKHLGLPVIIVSRNQLGTINHTLLTLQALQDLPVLGVVLSGEDPTNVHHQTIESYGKTKIIGMMPTKETLELYDDGLSP
jgi:dethiobiotin synthetase